ncbi:hypothetical protein SNOG_15535 [Parastagonospora nodorum SN15]|uniref:Uncharacterized protein n=1 Tax=Phaeosphaeria nodorum (strain SN15 / ATCC MYA-4574 / FGSC 10173) TaxID=321614 RepID=Q0TYJ8_PHANO|nr:hypothetical protein SNOG_15535 [Parastagonospora nodorum SN15]EAT77200.2 hypothetical protein SNOG_15535 [Parastagonospora nodorum SN15]
MKAFGTIAVGAFLLQSPQVRASPIEARGWGSVPDAAESLLKYIGISKELLPDATKLWDFKDNPQMCQVRMETNNGANCKATVECNDGVREYNPAGAGWNVCFVGGRQYFNDPRIGDFSITFAEKNGKGQGQGLTTPILQVKYIDDWKVLPVQGLAEEFLKYEDCDRQGLFTCNKGPYICRHGDMGNSYIQDSKLKRWTCGIPKIGKGEGPLNSNAPTNNKGFAPGWCGIHVVQYQKPNPAKDSYSLEVTRVNDIPPFVRRLFFPGWAYCKCHQQAVKTGAVDADPVRFAYGGQSWDSNDKARCSVGKYDNGKRQLDCGFTCE